MGRMTEFCLRFSQKTRISDWCYLILVVSHMRILAMVSVWKTNHLFNSNGLDHVCKWIRVSFCWFIRHNFSIIHHCYYARKMEYRLDVKTIKSPRVIILNPTHTNTHNKKQKSHKGHRTSENMWCYTLLVPSIRHLRMANHQHTWYHTPETINSKRKSKIDLSFFFLLLSLTLTSAFCCILLS